MQNITDFSQFSFFFFNRLVDDNIKLMRNSLNDARKFVILIYQASCGKFHIRMFD